MRDLRKVFVDLCESGTLSNLLPHHGFVTAQGFGEPDEGMGVDNIIVEILVIVVGRELVSCVKPRYELDAHILLTFILEVCLVEIDDVPKGEKREERAGR